MTEPRSTEFGADWPVLKFRAHGPGFHQVDELTLGGIDLLPLMVTKFTLTHSGWENPIAEATITFEVTPDVEFPTGVTFAQRDHEAKADV